MDRETKSGWLLALLALSLVAAIGGGAIYMNSVAERYVEQSERRDCEGLAADISAVESGGQLTEAGARVTQVRRARYAQIGCEPPLPTATYRTVTPFPVRPSPVPSR